MRKVVFVCHGNICRSPMAMYVLRRRAAEAGLDLTVTSVGVSDEEIGNGLDPRARRTLMAAGYEVDESHAAKLVQPADLKDAIVVAMEERHARIIRRIAPTAEVHLLTEFDPQAAPGSGVADPWYGSEAGFGDTLAQLERAMPALIEHLR